MSERKIINKYYPPDFDPSKIVKTRKKTRESVAASLPTVRLMAPFSMRCTTCGEFVYKGKKFNARKQHTGETYLGIKIIRFYIRCPRCSGEIRFKTDPKIGDYVTEFGAVRNHEPWRERSEEIETLEQRLDRLEREQQEHDEKEQQKRLYGVAGPSAATVTADGEDLMAQLEDKVSSAKREMDIQDELDELRARNARIDIAATSLIDKAQEQAGADEENARSRELEADELAAQNAFKRTSDGTIIRPLEKPKMVKPVLFEKQPIFKVAKKKPNSLGVVVNKKKRTGLI
jgi:hypothetical protein